MKKITILALHLNYGGIERFITNLANSISSEYDVEIISTYKLLDEPFFKLNNNVNVKYLIADLKLNRNLIKKYIREFNVKQLFKEIITSLKILRYRKKCMINYIKNCNSDIIISTRDIHNKWLGKYAKDGIMKIGSEHNDINSSKYINKISKTVKNLDYFVVVSAKMVNDYKDYLDIPIIHIPNTIERLPESISGLNNNNIISVGRLESVKGFEDLIRVMKIIVSKNNSIVLNIVGDGSQYDLLKSEIDKFNLNNNIKLLGYKNSFELSNLYNESSIYVMTSFSESFGLVLLEAQSHKLPCIAFDSANGAKELIHDGVDGYLIKNRDIEKMADMIIELIDDKDKCKKLGENALINCKKYLSENIKQKWVDIFEK